MRAGLGAHGHMHTMVPPLNASLHAPLLETIGAYIISRAMEPHGHGAAYTPGYIFSGHTIMEPHGHGAAYTPPCIYLADTPSWSLMAMEGRVAAITCISEAYGVGVLSVLWY